MAYADISFYYGRYSGNILDDKECIKWLDRASDEIDHLTGRKLVSAFPEDEHDAIAVRKAVCAIADVLYSINEQQKASMAQKAEDGTWRHAVKSITSGRESISYAIGEADTAYAAAAADPAKRDLLVLKTAERYLAGVSDRNGTNLLYAGG